MKSTAEECTDYKRLTNLFLNQIENPKALKQIYAIVRTIALDERRKNERI